MWFFFKIIKRLKTLNGSEGGVTLIETLIALAILGAIVAAIGSGLATTSKTVFIADRRSTIESLAISQMEHSKNSAYINFSDPGHGDYELISTPSGYSVEITATIAPRIARAIKVSMRVIPPSLPLKVLSLLIILKKNHIAIFLL